MPLNNLLIRGSFGFIKTVLAQRMSHIMWICMPRAITLIYCTWETWGLRLVLLYSTSGGRSVWKWAVLWLKRFSTARQDHQTMLLNVQMILLYVLETTGLVWLHPKRPGAIWRHTQPDCALQADGRCYFQVNAQLKATVLNKVRLWPLGSSNLIMKLCHLDHCK